MSAPTRRDILAIAGAFVAGGMLGACGGSGSGKAFSKLRPPKAEVDGDLSYHAWENYVAPEVIEGFEKEYGVEVKQTYFSSGDQALAKLAAKEPYDVTFTGSQQVPRLREAGLLLPIDHRRLEHRDEVLEYFRDPPYDPGSKAIVAPYAVGGVGLAWRKDKVDGAFTGSWRDLWTNAPKAKGHTMLLDEYEHMLSMSLAVNGHAIDAADAGQLAQAVESLIELKPHLAGYQLSATQLNTGEAWLTPAWAGDWLQTLSQSDHPETLGFQWCEENLLFNSDNLVIPVRARHPGTAMLFVDWLLRPDNMRKTVKFIGYPIPTKAGMKAYEKLIADHPDVHYDLSVMTDDKDWIPVLEPAEERLWNQAWTRAKAGG